MADIRISQLPSAPSSITGAELVPIVQNGQTVQTTVYKLVNSPTQTQTFVTVNNEPSLANSRRIGGGLGIGTTDTGTQLLLGLNGVSSSLESASNGFIVKNSSSTVINRSIVVSSNGISITNGNGISGNPTIGLTGLVLSLAGVGGVGLLSTDGVNVNPTSVSGTANQITVVNGTISPVISITNNPTIGGQGSITVPSGTTAQRLGTAGALRYNTDLGNFEFYTSGGWNALVTGTLVSSFSAGTTGFSPSSTSTGAITLSGILNTANGGTGTSALTGYVYGNGAGAMTASLTIPLSTGVSGNLPIANGGTNSTSTPIAGGIVYGNGTSYQFSNAGSVGQFLQSAGAGAPIWSTISTLASTIGVSANSTNASYFPVFFTASSGTATTVYTATNYSFNPSTATLTVGSLTAINDSLINGLRIGIGGGASVTNTVVGANGLNANTTGTANCAFGQQTLQSNTTAGACNAFGQQALQANTTGNWNCAYGQWALYSNSTGFSNCAYGLFSLFSTTGYNNSAYGANSGQNVSTGTNNSFYGANSGQNVTTGSSNSIFGTFNGNAGGLDIRTTSNNIVLSDGGGNPRWYTDSTGTTGYAPSNGGVVTQLTSRTTGVTLNKPTGQITLVSAAGSATYQSFTVTNSTVKATDVIHLVQASGTDKYIILVTNVVAGSFQITFATTGGTTTEQPVFTFAILKGQIA